MGMGGEQQYNLKALTGEASAERRTQRWPFTIIGKVSRSDYSYGNLTTFAEPIHKLPLVDDDPQSCGMIAARTNHTPHFAPARNSPIALPLTRPAARRN